MAGNPDIEKLRPVDRMLNRVREEGPVLKLRDGALGIFSPGLANKVDKANSEHLKVIDSLVDFLKLRKNANPVAWREVRALIMERSGRLATPVHLRALYARMRAHFSDRCGVPQDLAETTWRSVSQALLPLVFDDLDPAAHAALVGEQEVRFRVQLDQGIRVPLGRRISNYRALRASTREITRLLKRRLRSGSVHEDYAQGLLTFVDRIGIDRVTYLVTVQLIAISGVPGMMAACLLYAMALYPEWRLRIRAEMDAIEPDELYVLPMSKLPCTGRFIKETMRIWSTPLVTRRVASRDINVDGVALKEGDVYELSSYIQHHSEQYWDNPETFDPDRWLPERRQAANGAYVPFGFAPRSCAGASVGHAQLLLFCALCVRDFDVEVGAIENTWVRSDGFAFPSDFRGVFSPRAGASKA